VNTKATKCAKFGLGALCVATLDLQGSVGNETEKNLNAKVAK